MAEEFTGSARRVQEAVAARGFALQVVRYPETTRTAAEAAAAIGCEVAQIAKSLVFRGKAERARRCSSSPAASTA